MKRKIILSIAIVAALMCMFAIVSSATEVNGIYYTFYSNDDVNTATVNSKNVNCSLEIVNIPETVEYNDVTYTVTELSESAFAGGNWAGNKIIKEVTIPRTVAKIGKHCFRECSSLVKVTNKAAGGAYSFTNAEFHNCKSLKIVDFSEAYGLRSIGQYAFTNAPLETVLLPEGLEDIASSVFSGKTGITEIKLPSTLKKISGKQAFSSTAFTSIVLPAGLTALGNNIFQSSKLESIVIPATVQTVGEHCFNSTSSLRYVVIANPDVSGYNSRIFYSSAVDLIFFAGTEEDAKTFAARLERATFTNFVSYEDYLDNPDINSYSDTIVYGTANCECGYIVTNDEPTFNFTSFTEKMTISKKCAYCEKETVIRTIEAMFTCLGYSAPENGKGGIAIGFTVNSVAIAEYKEVTGKTLSYGIFAAIKDRLNGSDIFVDGEANECAFVVDMTTYATAAFEIKIVGFETDDQKNAQIAMGAYVKVDNDYSYMQNSAPDEGEKYCFDSLNDIVAQLASK